MHAFPKWYLDCEETEFCFLYISYKLDGLKLHGVYKNINNMQKSLQIYEKYYILKTISNASVSQLENELPANSFLQSEVVNSL